MKKTTPIQNALRHFAITPSDTAKIECKRIFVGAAGNVVLKIGDDGTAITYAAAAGTYIDVSADYVMAATTATGLVGLDW